MDKVYVRFGEFSKREELLSCYEAIIEDHIVKIILPTTTYPSCQSIARVIDEPAFIVTGEYTGKDKNGNVLLSNINFKIPLKYDKEIENYVTDFSIPKKKNNFRNITTPKWFRK